MARSERIRVRGRQKCEWSSEDVQMYSLALWLQAKRVLADRRRAAEKAKAKRRRIECQREGRDER